MEIKTKIRNIYKIKISIILFFVLLQINQVQVTLAASINVEEMVSLTNKSREQAGLSSLIVNDKLTQAAREKANDMFVFEYFDHNSPSGLTPWDFILRTGYKYKYAGENLAIDFVSAKGAHNALMESRSHRDNILNEHYTEIGIAVIEGIFEGDKSIIIVEEFASPLQEQKISQDDFSKEFEVIIKKKKAEINDLYFKTAIANTKEKVVAQKNNKQTVNKNMNKTETVKSYISKECPNKKVEMLFSSKNNLQKEKFEVGENDLEYENDIWETEKLDSLFTVTNAVLIEKENSCIKEFINEEEIDFTNVEISKNDTLGNFVSKTMVFYISAMIISIFSFMSLVYFPTKHI